MDDEDCHARAGNFLRPADGWVQATPHRVSKTAAWLGKSFLVGRPVMKLTGLAFSLGFSEKKIQFSRCRVALHLPRAQSVITRADPRSEPGKFRRGKLLGGLFDFFNRAHGDKLTDLRKGFKFDSILLRLRRYRLSVALQRRHDGVPGQDGTFDARRKFINAGKHRQLAKVAL